MFERKTSLPLSVAILIDTSGSTRIDLHYEVESVARFLPTLLERAIRTMHSRCSVSIGGPVELDSRAMPSARNALCTRCTGKAERRFTTRSIWRRHAERARGAARHYRSDGRRRYNELQTLRGCPGRGAADAVLMPYPIVVVPIPNDAGRNTGGEHARSRHWPLRRVAGFSIPRVSASSMRRSPILFRN